MAEIIYQIGAQIVSDKKCFIMWCVYVFLHCLNRNSWKNGNLEGRMLINFQGTFLLIHFVFSNNKMFYGEPLVHFSVEILLFTYAFITAQLFCVSKKINITITVKLLRRNLM